MCVIRSNPIEGADAGVGGCVEVFWRGEEAGDAAPAAAEGDVVYWQERGPRMFGVDTYLY
jgi:hypothetical protein